MDVVKLLQELIQADSPSGREAPAAQVLSEALARIGLSPSLDQVGNVEAVLGDGGKEVLLTGHMDVVPAGEAGDWLHPPLSGTVVDGAVWGRGSVDMKGALAAMVAAMDVLRSRSLAGRVRFLGVVQEEIGGLGSRFAADRISPMVAVIGEPSSLELMRGHRGRAEFSLDFQGKMAHAARPELGENPLLTLGHFLHNLNNLVLPSHPELGPASCTPTRVASLPESSNVVPGLAQLVIDYRFLPDEDPQQILSVLRDRAGDASVYVLDAERVSGQVEMRFPAIYPPYLIAADHPVVLRAQRALGTTSSSMWWFMTDAPYLAGRAPVIGYGPGDATLAHTTREHLPVRELEAAVRGYVRLVEGLWA